MSAPAYYCFDPATLALLETLSGGIDQRFADFTKMGDHYIPRNIAVRIGNQIALTISIQLIDLIDAKDQALIPSPNAVVVPRSGTDIFDRVTSGEQAQRLVKKTFPVYPQQAKNERIQGFVVLGATIGVDGKISDLEVLSSPSPILSQSAIDCVKAWEYKPFTVDGKAVEVETIIHVIYTLSG